MEEQVAPVASEAPAAPAEGPRTSQDVAASVVRESEAPAPVEAPPPEPELSEAAKFIVSKGHKWGKRPDGKTDLSWLPASTVAGFLDSYVDQHRAQWDTRHSALEKERDSHKADLEEFINSLRGDDRAFLEQVSKYDQRYAKYLTPQEKVELAVDAGDPEPQLDYTNGQEAFDKSLRAQRAWDRRQATREAEAKTKAVVEPFQRQRQQDEFMARDRAAVQQQMADMQTWEGFGAISPDNTYTPHQQAVLDMLIADTAEAKKTGRKLMSVKEAHLTVLAKSHSEQLKALAATDEANRKKYAEEMNKAPKSTSIARTGSDAVSAPKGERTTRDIVAEAVARAEA